jgi:hypothetical protein
VSFVKRSATRLSSLVCLLAVFFPAAVVAQNYSFTNIDYPDASYTFPQALNDSGHVVGFWGDSQGNVHGFYWDGTNFTSIDYPGAGATYAQGINDAGVISGFYETNSGTQSHAFILDNGTFTSYDYPGFAGQTNGEGINNHGATTGYYGSGGSTGFFNNNGSFSSFGYPGACWTVPYSLNDSEQAAGDYRADCSTGFLGFFYSNGTFTTLEYPDDTDTYAAGVNNNGVVTGYSTINDPPYLVAWLWQNGRFTAIATNEHYVQPVGINNNGQLVGVYEPNTTHGFIATPTVSSAPSQFVPIVPCRVVDTRNPSGQFGGPPISGGNSRSFPIPQGGCAIPSSATAYSLNVTLVPISHGRVRYLTIWPTGQTQPTVSTMNSDGRVKADAATVPAGTGGAVSVYVTDTTNVILDIDGYYISPVSGTLEFYPLTPCRIADTRSTQYPTGLGQPHLTGGTPRDFPMLNSSCIPSNANALAYSLNLTAIPYQGSPLGYLEIWPTGYEPPSPVSTLNNPNAVTVANAAIVGAPPSGEITVYANDNTDLAIDINGYFAEAGSGLQLYTIPPCRVIDTRNGGGQGFNGTLSPPVNVTTSGCGIPSSAGAYVFNATAIPVQPLGYLTLWPDNEQQPGVSTLNASDKSVTSNMAVVPNTTGDGKVDAYASGTTQLILDIAAYFAQ